MSNKEKFTRRDFAQVALIGSFALLAACQKESNLVESTALPTGTPTTVPTELPTQTSTPEPTATTTPEPTSTEVINPIEQIPYNPEQRILVLEHHNPSYGVKNNEYEPVYMTAENFEEQLKKMQEMNFYTPAEEELLGWLDGKHGLPEKSVIIRMDIGIPQKDYELGFQLLEKYNFNTILFILTSMLPELESEKMVGWDTIQRYIDRGTVIPGSHGTYHPYYSKLSEADALWDALNSKEIIEEKLGREIYFFAYPYDNIGHDDALLGHYKMLFATFGTNYAHAGNPRVGTYYPYIQKGFFNWERFDKYLGSVSEETQQ